MTSSILVLLSSIHKKVPIKIREFDSLLYWLCLFLHFHFARKNTSTHFKQFVKMLEYPNKQFELLVFGFEQSCLSLAIFLNSIILFFFCSLSVMLVTCWKKWAFLMRTSLLKTILTLDYGMRFNHLVKPSTSLHTLTCSQDWLSQHYWIQSKNPQFVRTCPNPKAQLSFLEEAHVKINRTLTKKQTLKSTTMMDTLVWF